MLPLLFVYGTLRPGYPNRYARLLTRHSCWIGEGHTPGRLYQVRQYVGLLPARHSWQRVQGEIVRLRYPARTLRLLDAYEGCPEGLFTRVSQPVMAGPRRLTAWVYRYTGLVPLRYRIPSGSCPP